MKKVSKTIGGVLSASLLVLAASCSDSINENAVAATESKASYAYRSYLDLIDNTDRGFFAGERKVGDFSVSFCSTVSGDLNEGMTINMLRNYYSSETLFRVYPGNTEGETYSVKISGDFRVKMEEGKPVFRLLASDGIERFTSDVRYVDTVDGKGLYHFEGTIPEFNSSIDKGYVYFKNSGLDGVYYTISIENLKVTKTCVSAGDEIIAIDPQDFLVYGAEYNEESGEMIINNDGRAANTVHFLLSEYKGKKAEISLKGLIRSTSAVPTELKVYYLSNSTSLTLLDTLYFTGGPYEKDQKLNVSATVDLDGQSKFLFVYSRENKLYNYRLNNAQIIIKTL